MREADHADGIVRRRGQAKLPLALLMALACGGYLAAMAATGALVPRSPGAVARPAAGQQASPSGAASGSTSAGSGPATAPRHPIAQVRVHGMVLGGSSVVNGEPSIALDSAGRIFITGPTGIGHMPTQTSSPLWVSTDGGGSFTGPVNTETGGEAPTGLGGGDSDLVVDAQDNLYLTTLWLGNTSMAVSSDNGATWVEQPIGHLNMADDRPWLTYDPVGDTLWMDYDGYDGIHVAKASLRTVTTGTAAAPPTSIVFAPDVLAVPESPVGGAAVPNQLRQCACPPGTITVDPTGTVHLAFSSQQGIGIASSSDGLVWSTTYIPHSAPPGGSALALDNDFQVLRGDSDGNLYVAWTVNLGRSDAVFYSYLQNGATTWHPPVEVSTTDDAVFGTLAVVAPGTIDVAYLGTEDYDKDPNKAPIDTSWDLYLTQVQHVFDDTPALSSGDMLTAVHNGSIDTSGLCNSATSSSPCPDRSLGDFFGLAVDQGGMADIATAVGNDINGTTIEFVHQSGPLSSAPVELSPGPPSQSSATGATQSPSASGGGTGARPVRQQHAPAAPVVVTQPQAPAAGNGGVSTVTQGTATTHPENLQLGVAAAASESGGPIWGALIACAVVTLLGGLVLRRMSR